jgi:methyltransferase (TIGR00027 family)
MRRTASSQPRCRKLPVVQSEEPSRTAWGAAVHRAAHQVLEQGRIFSDPLALRVLGEDAESIVREAERRTSKRPMRMFIAVRTRFAEDALAAAVAHGVTQLAVLGAGLDTFAYRSPFGDRLRVFEVDHPATQAWKRELLEQAGIAAPSSLTFAPIDLERQSLAAGLASVGFDPGRQTFFTWLGVVPYLTADAVWSTLAYIGALPGGAHLVFDYSDPPETLAPDARARHDKVAERVEAAGEAFRSYFEADGLHAGMRSLGFCEIEDLGPLQITARWFPDSTSAPREKGGHILRASTRGVSPDRRTDPPAG